MLDTLLRPSTSTGLATSCVLSFGQIAHHYRVRRAECWAAPRPCLDVVCGNRKGKSKGKSTRSAQPAQQVQTPAITLVPQCTCLLPSAWRSSYTDYSAANRCCSSAAAEACN